MQTSDKACGKIYIDGIICTGMSSKPGFLDGEKDMPIVKWGHETEIVDVNWLWKPYIPFGKVTLVEGDGGDGKTTMILTIATMHSKGIQPPALERGHLLPQQECEPITTFYLTNEDEVADSSLKRFIRADGDTKRFAYSGELEHHMVLVEEELMAVIEETHARLLIIDPFQAFLPDGTNLGSITKMRSIFTTLANVAKKTSVAIVLIGHLNKNESSKDIHRGFGSADIAASVRSILLVEMDKKDRENRWVRAIKSNFDESDYTPIRLIMDDDRRISFAEFESEEEDDEIPQTKIGRGMVILKELLADGPVPVAEINKIMAKDNISDKTAQRSRKGVGAIQDFIDGKAVWFFPDQSEFK